RRQAESRGIHDPCAAVQLVKFFRDRFGQRQAGVEVLQLRQIFRKRRDGVNVICARQQDAAASKKLVDPGVEVGTCADAELLAVEARVEVGVVQRKREG